MNIIHRHYMRTLREEDILIQLEISYLKFIVSLFVLLCVKF